MRRMLDFALTSRTRIEATFADATDANVFNAQVARSGKD